MPASRMTSSRRSPDLPGISRSSYRSLTLSALIPQRFLCDEPGAGPVARVEAPVHECVADRVLDAPDPRAGRTREPLHEVIAGQRAGEPRLLFPAELVDALLQLV